MSARSRELAILVVAGLIGSTAFASAWITTEGTIDYAWVPWALVLAALFLVAHVIARITVPDADPTLLPLAALICAVGLTFVYRVEPADGRKQVVWVALGVLVFCVVLLVLRWDYRVLEKYKYLFGVTAVVLLMLPSVPGTGPADQRGQALGARSGRSSSSRARSRRSSWSSSSRAISATRESRSLSAG